MLRLRPSPCPEPTEMEVDPFRFSP